MLDHKDKSKCLGFYIVCTLNIYYVDVMNTVNILFLCNFYSKGRGAFKDRSELKTKSKYTLRHTEKRVNINKRPRDESKDDQSTCALTVSCILLYIQYNLIHSIRVSEGNLMV